MLSLIWASNNWSGKGLKALSNAELNPASLHFSQASKHVNCMLMDFCKKFCTLVKAQTFSQHNGGHEMAQVAAKMEERETEVTELLKRSCISPFRLKLCAAYDKIQIHSFMNF